MHACVGGDWKWVFFKLVHGCRLLLVWEVCFGRGRDRGFVFVYFSILAGVRVVGVYVLVYACTHTQTTWVIDVSPGVGRKPGEPEEPRSTKAQYTFRPYRCTKYICLY